MRNIRVESIQDAAKKVFSEKGYKEATMAQISKCANITPATLYKYFKSKRELFESINMPQVESFRPKYEKTKQKILKSALTIFGQKGYSGTSLEEVASLSGFSQAAAIYNYFSSKEELFKAIFEEYDLNTCFKDFPVITSETDLSTVLKEIGTSFLNILSKPNRISITRILISDTPKFPEIGELFYNLSIERVQVRVAEHLQAICSGTNYRDVDFKFIARSFLGILFSFTVMDNYINNGKKEYSNDQIVKGTVDIIIHSLKPEFKDEA